MNNVFTPTLIMAVCLCCNQAARGQDDTEKLRLQLELLKAQNEHLQLQLKQTRSGSSAALVDNGDGTVTDTRYQLMWCKEPSNLLNLGDMSAYASRCRIGGYSDWRLPTVEDMQNLYTTLAPQPITAQVRDRCLPPLSWNPNARGLYCGKNLNTLDYQTGLAGGVRPNDTYSVRLVRYLKERPSQAEVAIICSTCKGRGTTAHGQTEQVFSAAKWGPDAHGGKVRISRPQIERRQTSRCSNCKGAGYVMVSGTGSNQDDRESVRQLQAQERASEIAKAQALDQELMASIANTKWYGDWTYWDEPKYFAFYADGTFRYGWEDSQHVMAMYEQNGNTVELFEARNLLDGKWRRVSPLSRVVISDGTIQGDVPDKAGNKPRPFILMYSGKLRAATP